MYKVMQNDNLVGYSDTVVWVKLAKNGCYVPCEKNVAQGMCVKTPYTYTHTNEETGETTIINSVRDVVYSLYEGTLNGTEEVAYLETTNGPIIIQDTQDQLVAIMEYQKMMA